MGECRFRSRCSPVDTNKAQELVSRLGLALEASEDAAGDGGGAPLLDAAHDHAEMAGLHDDGDALGLEDLHDGVGDFLGEALLDLETAGVHLGDAGEFGEADDGVGGDVTDVHLEITCISIFFLVWMQGRRGAACAPFR